jgi:hypothetical protein
MEYDNKTFVVQSFRDEPVVVKISVNGNAKELRNLATGEMLEASAPLTGVNRRKNRKIASAEQRANFEIKVQPHSFEAFTVAGAQ